MLSDMIFQKSLSSLFYALSHLPPSTDCRMKSEYDVVVFLLSLFLALFR
jgi:hypothetical protein